MEFALSAGIAKVHKSALKWVPFWSLWSERCLKRRAQSRRTDTCWWPKLMPPLSPCSLVPQMLQLCGDSVVTGTEWCGFPFWLSPIFHRRFQDVSRSFAGEMCWSTVSNLSFRKFAVFASRFSWVFSPDICWSKSEVPEEHLQVLLLPKNFKVELDHWHLTANVSVFYTFLKFWHIKMSGSTDEIFIL